MKPTIVFHPPRPLFHSTSDVTLWSYDLFSSDVDGPLSPLCQLLGVLPLDSRHLLPPAFLPLTQPATDTTPAGDLAPYFPAYEEVPVGAVLCVVAVVVVARIRVLGYEPRIHEENMVFCF